jgi:hypothetical protein
VAACFRFSCHHAATRRKLSPLQWQLSMLKLELSVKLFKRFPFHVLSNLCACKAREYANYLPQSQAIQPMHSTLASWV